MARELLDHLIENNSLLPICCVYALLYIILIII